MQGAEEAEGHGPGWGQRPAIGKAGKRHVEFLLLVSESIKGKRVWGKACL